MKLIEEKLHQLHAEAKEKKKLQSQQKSEECQVEENKAPPLKGFAKVNVVTDGSPAALAVSTNKSHTSVIEKVVQDGVLSIRSCLGDKLRLPARTYI